MIFIEIITLKLFNFPFEKKNQNQRDIKCINLHFLLLMLDNVSKSIIVYQRNLIKTFHCIAIDYYRLYITQLHSMNKYTRQKYLRT